MPRASGPAGAVAFAFALFLAYRFLAEVVTVALSLAVGALLAVAASGPVGALSRRKAPRPLAALAVFLGGAVLIVLGALLLLPTITEQITGFLSSLPGASPSSQGAPSGSPGGSACRSRAARRARSAGR